ncbi:MAG: 2-oxo acid dehydrogenase subunit E2 [Bdellovibrionales bacterium]|nr:2-oxo acid dehydrogenase subunit E2 [Bdellovibrionales bacterium]
MSTEVKLPDIGEGVTEGELVKWLVQVGDTIEEDQPIAEVMTDKATVEVPSPYAGTVKELKANEGDIIPIETTMLLLDAGTGTGATKSPVAKESIQSSTSTSVSTQIPTPAPAPAINVGGMEVHPPVAESRVLATPATRRLARELGLDINIINGTGNAGRVTREDVLQAKNGATTSYSLPSSSAPKMEIPKPAFTSHSPQLEERVALRGIRRKIAEQMQITKHIVPHFTLMDEANITELVKMRAQAKQVGEAYGVKVTFLPFIMKALIATLREFPMFNASIDDDKGEIVYKKYFNIGFAADTPQGLLVPNVKNADQKTILELSKEIQELADKARNGKLSLEEMKGATFTITNIGSVGGTYATPIINHPEVGILGVYKIMDKPVLKDGKFRAAKMQNYTVTCDHRLIDGAVAANFLRAFFQKIENPSHLMLNMM